MNQAEKAAFRTVNMLAAFLVSVSALGCWDVVADRYNLPVELLKSVGQVESSFRPEVVAHANNGTRSIGVMQINSSWFGELQAFGIAEKDLYKPCVNIEVGGWILAQEVKRYGYSWEALGAYYAGPYNKKTRSWKLKHYREYATKVLDVWRGKTKTVEVAKPAAPGEVFGGIGRITP